ncbi:MAG: flagellar export protein FliJ [Lachnospiraceae bacterium]|nr:flagellar export protein FliJ [Lachnospiraceae bacterium]
MAKFIFKMENILKVKRKLENQAQSAYALALAKVQEEEEKLQQLSSRKTGYEKKLAENMLEFLQIQEIKRLEDAVELMKYRILEQKVVLENAKIQAERARVKLQEAMVERKTYEKLKEKAFEAFKLEVNAQEKKEVDELVSYKFAVPNENMG